MVDVFKHLIGQGQKQAETGRESETVGQREGRRERQS